MSKRDKTQEIRKAILKKLKNNGHKTYKPKELARQLGYHSHTTYRTFRATLQELVRQGTIHREKGNRFSLKGAPTENAEGTLSVSRDGYGFVDVEGSENDIFIPRNKIRSAMDGDRVRILVRHPVSSSDRIYGEILEVLERNTQKLTGTTKIRGGTVYILPDEARFKQRIYIHESESAGIRSGKKVVTELGDFDSYRNAFRAKNVILLGDAEDPEVLMQALISHFNLPQSFPDPVINETDRIPDDIPAHEYERRLDLRDKPVFTIDPEDAKDFDDAIHVTPLPDGTFEVGVHIADVSHYVPLNTAIDKEALLRSTSVYLADRVVPMIPERLSNHLCSLRPGEDKLTFSCILILDEKATVHSFKFAETVIHSKQRFTYRQAQDIIEGIDRDHPMAHHVLQAQKIAHAFTKKRFKKGSVEFDMPEVRIRLDENGHPVDIVVKEIKESNRLIEEFMLLANQSAARAIEKPATQIPPFIYRVHDRPDQERLQKLITYVKTFGLQFDLNDELISSEDLNTLLTSIKGTPREAIIKTAALRAMAKACYSHENIGHYGLGFSHYSHFTSPIRRYPDLIAHRLMKEYLFGASRGISGNIKPLCEHCSTRERHAEEAERASIRQKQVLLAKKYIGQHFDGVITSVTKFGLFVELNGLWLEGLVHVKDLLDDYYEYHEDTFTLAGSHTGTSFHAGDQVRVQLAKANPDTREIELVLVDK